MNRRLLAIVLVSLSLLSCTSASPNAKDLEGVPTLPPEVATNAPTSSFTPPPSPRPTIDGARLLPSLNGMSLSTDDAPVGFAFERAVEVTEFYALRRDVSFLQEEPLRNLIVGVVVFGAKGDALEYYSDRINQLKTRYRLVSLVEPIAESAPPSPTASALPTNTPSPTATSSTSIIPLPTMSTPPDPTWLGSLGSMRSVYNFVATTGAKGTLVVWLQGSAVGSALLTGEGTLAPLQISCKLQATRMPT